MRALSARHCCCALQTRPTPTQKGQRRRPRDLAGVQATDAVVRARQRSGLIAMNCMRGAAQAGIMCVCCLSLSRSTNKSALISILLTRLSLRVLSCPVAMPTAKRPSCCHGNDDVFPVVNRVVIGHRA